MDFGDQGKAAIKEEKKETKLNCKTSSGAKATENKHEQKAKSRGLMTKLGKSDLLRLLSILEGELEAQDIFIADLQGRVQQDANNYVKKRYYHHSMTDPFLALKRDNDMVAKASEAQNDDEVHIEPLPLLEKVVTECKRQQFKVRQHIALSDAYYKLVNTELLEVKRKYARDTAVGDDVTAALEKEREKLKLQIRVEETKSKKVEADYKKLLQAVNEERQRFQIIVTMLLEERNGRFSKTVDLDEFTLDEIKDKYKELLLKNEELETELKTIKEKETKLPEKLNQLKSTSSPQTALSDTAVKTDKSTTPSFPSLNSEEKPSEPSSSSASDVNSSSSSSTANKAVTVTVRRTPTVIEKKLVTPRDRYLAKANPPSIKSPDVPKEPSRIPSHPDKMNLRSSSDLSLKFSSSGIVSSPTSGASNFALNSPNQPSTTTSFPAPALPTKTKKINVSSGSFQATRQKFQRFSSPKPCPPTTHKNEASHSKRHVKVGGGTSGEIVSSAESPLPSVSSHSKSDAKSGTRKSLENSFKPQPPKPHRVGSAKYSREEAKEKTNPPPLPPKKPNLLSKTQNNGKPSSLRNSKDSDTRKSVHHSGSDKASRPTSANSKISGSGISKGTVGNLHHPSSSQLKRPSSQNANNNNNSNRAISRISTSCHGRHSLSAQQRLFPPQGGSDGPPRSPITNTVPKSPLESCAFTFK